MQMNNEELEKFVEETINENKLNKINNIYLSNRQIQILNRYNIDYKNAVDISDLIFKVEEFINENYSYDDISDLEVICFFFKYLDFISNKFYTNIVWKYINEE